MVVVAGVIALSSLVLFLWRSSWTRDARAAESVAAAPPASPPILDPPSISGMREAVDSSAPPPSADWLEVVDDAGEPLVGTSVQVSRKEAAASEPGIRAAAPAPPTRGRLVDEATLEPIPDALVATSKRNDWTDANGWFDTGDLLDGLDDLLVVNFGDNSNKSEIPKASWTRTRHAWQIPLTIGPTFRLRFRDGDVPHPGTWEARLMRESDSDGVWHGLHKGSPPYIRFGAPLRELVAGEHAWIEARSLDGLNDGRGDVSSLVGVHEVEIACRQRAVLRGRVVDEKGLPWRYVMLNAVQLSRGAEESLHASTGADGTYQLSAREPGTMLVAFRQGFYARAQDLQTHVPLGVTQAPDTVLERLPTGTIRGRLRRSTREVPVPCSLRLRALEGSEFEVVRDFVLGEPRVGERAKLAQEKDPTDAQEFQFQSIPAGSYELTAISMDGFACSPAALQVRTPAEGIDFSFDNGVQRRSYVLNLVDAGSGAALEPIFADVLVDGAWSDSDMLPDRGGPLVTLAEGIGFEWRATSPGYEMTRGSDADFHLEGESLVATRALRPGFAVRLRLRNQIAGQDASELAYSMSVRWGTPAVAGADVLADGELVATSDADGIADVQLASEPARIEIRLAGWRVLDSPSFRKGRPLSLPTSEVWMVRE
jgi:hypothetical protein